MLQMIRDLTDNEMHEMLQEEHYGHLGCLSPDGMIYIVPVAYVYSENAIHVFSFEGEKTKFMRENPEVTFQVEQLNDDTSWRSVMIHGEFEELSGEDRERTLGLLIDRLWQESSRGRPIYMPFRNSPESLRAAGNDENVVLYRIAIKEKTGRMEKW